MARVFIGTSGFLYPHWQNIFYPQSLPQKKWLSFYAKNFDTVEINATFYHSMKTKTFENWRKITGPNFVFAVKASRFITHIKRLKNCQEPLERMIQGVKALRSAAKFFPGSKLSKASRLHQSSKIDKPFAFNFDVVLFQLPPNWKATPNRLKKFLKLLPKNFRFAFEFRDSSWLDKKIYQILKEKNCALVIQDSPKWSKAEVVTTDFCYLRFHGAESLYSSCYTKDELKVWAKKIQDWLGKGIDVYAYFNNDVGGYAISNARALKKFVTAG